MRKVIHGKSKGEHIDGSGRADVIYGNGGNDGIGGHGGDDKLYGGAGNDRLHGGQGHDLLVGNSGKDTFIFRSFAEADSDTVKDFNHKADSVELDNTVFTALELGKLADTNFHLGTQAADEDDFIIYDSETGNLYYDDDGNGSNEQFLIAVFNNHPDLGVDDFFVAVKG